MLFPVDQTYKPAAPMRDEAIAYLKEIAINRESEPCSYVFEEPTCQNHRDVALVSCSSCGQTTEGPYVEEEEDEELDALGTWWRESFLNLRNPPAPGVATNMPCCGAAISLSELHAAATPRPIFASFKMGILEPSGCFDSSEVLLLPHHLSQLEQILGCSLVQYWRRF